MSSTSVDGQWGQWGRWGRCSRQCGGSQTRVRLCDSPEQQNGGRFCVGYQIDEQPCNILDSCDLGNVIYECRGSNYQFSLFSGRFIGAPGGKTGLSSKFSKE